MKRMPLNRERVLLAAVAMADRDGLDAISMRNLSQDLGVVPMALYKHVANKEELLDGMIDVIVAEIDPAPSSPDPAWKGAVRRRILSSRRALLRHPWAPRLIESRTRQTASTLDYANSLIGMLRAGGVSVDLAHHAMHALGSRMWGFSQEVFPTPADGPAPLPPGIDLVARYPHIVEMATAARPHEPGSVVGSGCDDQFEFEFALDLLLDGIEKRHRSGWTSHG